MLYQLHTTVLREVLRRGRRVSSPASTLRAVLRLRGIEGTGLGTRALVFAPLFVVST